MSSIAPCCRLVSVQQKDNFDFADWDFFSERHLEQLMYDIFGNMEESEFGLEYLFRVDRRLRANTSKRLYHTPPIFKGILKPKPHLQGDILTPTLLQWGLVPIPNLLKLINFITVHKKNTLNVIIFPKN